MWELLEWATTLQGVGSLIAWPARWLLRRRFGRRSALIFANRRQLERAYPLRWQLRQGHEIHAWWLTGRGVFQQEHDFRTIRRLLLPHPDTPYLEILEESLSKHPYYNFKNDIEGVTRQAKSMGIEVRWFLGFPGLGITIVNPNADRAWVHVEVILPSATPDERMTIRVERNRQPEQFKAIYESFEYAWSSSQEPSATADRESRQADRRLAPKQGEHVLLVGERFAPIYSGDSRIAETLGKPTSAYRETLLSVQFFERAIMIWRKDRWQISVLYTDSKSWEAFDDLTGPEEEEIRNLPFPESPPRGRYEPAGGFKRVWLKHGVGPKARWARHTLTHQNFPGGVQEFEQGVMVGPFPRTWTLDPFPPSEWVFVLY